MNLDFGVKIDRRGQGLPRRRHDLAKSIREAILAMGGEAHRRNVIEALAREYGVDVLHIPEDLEAAVIRSFEETLRDDAKRAAFGFHLPFGEGSHRWGVKVAATVAN
jgi:hypothetical protein